MGIGMPSIEFFNRAINLTIGSIFGKRMVELGDQKIWGQLHVKDDGSRVWAKDWFEARGCHHYSIDIHGKNGSHALDLSEPLEDTFWHENFDIVTNFGTSEHVTNQIACWENIHNLGRAGSVYIHVVPERDVINPQHCLFTYTKDIFKDMCKANKYTLLLNESIRSLAHIGCCYVKPRQGVPYAS